MSDETPAVVVHEAPSSEAVAAEAEAAVVIAEAHTEQTEAHTEAAVAVAAIEAEAAVQIAEAHADAAVDIAEAQASSVSREEFDQCLTTLNTMAETLASIQASLTPAEPDPSLSSPEPASGEVTPDNPEAPEVPEPEAVKPRKRLKLI